MTIYKMETLFTRLSEQDQKLVLKWDKDFEKHHLEIKGTAYDGTTQEQMLNNTNLLSDINIFQWFVLADVLKRDTINDVFLKCFN